MVKNIGMLSQFSLVIAAFLLLSDSIHFFPLYSPIFTKPEGAR